MKIHPHFISQSETRFACQSLCAMPFEEAAVKSKIKHLINHQTFVI